MQGRAVVLGLWWAALTLLGCSLDRSPSGADPRRSLALTADAGAGEADAANGFGNPGRGGSAGSAPAADGGMAPDAGPLAPLGFAANGLCEPTGVYGMRISVDVAWGGRSNGLAYLTDHGRGRILVDGELTLHAVEADGSFSATLKPCNAVLPPFYSTILCEVYEPLFPTTLWDKPDMPALPVGGRFACGPTGCALQLDTATVLLGIALDAPERTWPAAAETMSIPCAAGTGVACFPDQDADMRPGITTAVRTSGASPPNQPCPNGYPLRAPPLSDNVAAIYNGVQRADRLGLGVRMSLAGEGVLGSDCIHGHGAGTAKGFNSRAVGCMVQTGTLNWPNPPAGPGTKCSEAERAFLDENLPNYSVLTAGQLPDPSLDLPDKSASFGTLLSLVRLGRVGEAVGCAAVRAATY